MFVYLFFCVYFLINVIVKKKFYLEYLKKKNICFMYKNFIKMLSGY